MTRDAPAEGDALVALGSNLPWRDLKPSAILRAALTKLGALGTIEARSGWWSTPAWPNPSDPPFLNLCVRLKGPRDPSALLEALLSVERELGRERSALNAPRTLDLDIVDFEGLALDQPAEGGRPALQLPHPRAHERAFVLLPLQDVAPLWRHPTLGLPVGALIARLPAKSLAGMRRLASGDLG